MDEPDSKVSEPTERRRLSGWGVVLLIAAAIALWTGLAMNQDHTEVITYQGERTTVGCDKGEAVSGPLLALEAREACEHGWADAQDDRPLWIGAGLVLGAIGVVKLRRSRA